MKEKLVLSVLVLSTLASVTYAALAMPAEETTVAPVPPAETLDPAPTTAPPKLKPRASAKVGETLMLSSQLSHPFILSGRGTAPTYLQIDVDATTRGGRTTTPLDVAIVIDRSGSMSGSKLTDAKRAAREFVARLKPHDRVALISYSSAARLETPWVSLDGPAQRARVEAAIGRLSSGGGTNILAALGLARQTFETRREGSRLQRVILLSDGRASGKESCARLAAEMVKTGVSTTTMGLGADYDEIMLTGIADGGSGNYYFIGDANNLKPTFDAELASLQNAVANNALLTLDLADGVSLGELHGFAFRHQGQHVEIPLEVFWSGRNASVLAELQVDRTRSGEFAAVTVGLRYDDLTSPRPAPPVLHTSSLTMAATASQDEVNAHINGEVLVRNETIESAAATNRAMVEYEAGNTEKAQRILTARGSALRERTSTLSRLGNFNGKDKTKLLDGLVNDAARSEAVAQDMVAQPAASPVGRKFVKKNRAVSRRSMQVF